MSDDFPIRVEQRGGIAVWTIDRADRANALSRATILAFGRLAREAVTNASIQAIVITGAGDKAFCAGADLKERQGMSENDVRVQVDLYRSELGPLDRSPKPVVAAINGAALGGGSSSPSAATSASPPRTRSSGCRRHRSGSSPGPEGRSGCRGWSARLARRR